MARRQDRYKLRITVKKYFGIVFFQYCKLRQVSRITKIIRVNNISTADFTIELRMAYQPYKILCMGFNISFFL